MLLAFWFILPALLNKPGADGDVERREANENVDDAVINITLGRGLAVAFDEVRLLRRLALERALAKEIMHKGPNVESNL